MRVHYTLYYECSEGKGAVVLYQWIEAVREFLNQKASELHDGMAMFTHELCPLLMNAPNPMYR